jgi:hypothetical protein
MIVHDRRTGVDAASTTNCGTRRKDLLRRCSANFFTSSTFSSREHLLYPRVFGALRRLATVMNADRMQRLMNKRWNDLSVVLVY